MNNKFKDLEKWTVMVDSDCICYITNTDSESKLKEIIEKFSDFEYKHVDVYKNLSSPWESAKSDCSIIQEYLDEDNVDVNSPLIDLVASAQNIRFINADTLDEIYSEIEMTEVLNMSEKNTKKDKNITSTLKNSAKTMGSAAAEGLKLASVEMANDAAYDKIIKPRLIQLGASQELANDPKFKEVILFCLPVMIHLFVSALEDKIPYAKFMQSYAEMAVTGNVQRNSKEVMKLLMELGKVMYDASGTLIQTMRVEYKDKSVPELKRIAKDRNLRIKASAKKDEILEALEEADAENLSSVMVG